jgi:membrane associated rhomboid family serine protease
LPQAILVGASGSILGVMAAAVCVAPRLPIRFWFPPITVRLWVMFLIAIVIALLAVRTSGDNAGGEAAHLGGAAGGLVAFSFRSKLGFIRSKKKSKLRPLKNSLHHGPNRAKSFCIQHGGF